MSSPRPARTAFPGLDSNSLRRLAAAWDDSGLWKDVQWLADRFWSTALSDAALAWHHLLLAVGNFKRQGGTRICPSALPASPVTRSEQPTALTVPGTEPPVRLTVDDSLSWQCLSDAIPGVAVATTTTLLAALWPDQHVVFDRRVHQAANGLRIAAGRDGTPPVTPESQGPAKQTFENYQVVRGWVLDTSAATGEAPTTVERALYASG